MIVHVVRRYAVRAGAALALVAGVATTADAQAAGSVTLRLRPRAGDTLQLRFEQSVYAAGAGGESLATAPGKAAVRLLSSMIVLSRSVVEQSDASGSVIVAHTDSVVIRMPGAPAEALARARLGMQGRVTRMRVAPDGAMQWMLPTAGRDAAVGGAPLGLPGALPAMAVAVGTRWTRTMPLPWSDGAPGSGRDVAPRLEVTFQLDSLARGGTLAYVSMRGRLHATPGTAARVGGAALAGGSADGALRLDLARGWIVDSRADFALDVIPPALSGPTPGRALGVMRLHITQRLSAR